MDRLTAIFGRWLGLCALLFLGDGGALTARAESVVTLCTQEELLSRIDEARDLSGDGLVIFDCDGVILLTNTIVLPFSLIEIEDDGSGGSVTNETALLPTITLDGTGHFITLSGATSTNATNGVRLFLVDSGVTLALTNLTLINGQSTNGGAIYVRTNATLLASDCVFSNNLAVTSHGIDGTSASADTVNGSAKDGRSGTSSTTAAGGAIYNLGFAEFVQCTFLTNGVVGGSGGSGGNGGNATIRAGDGGNGGKGGSGLGGAIYNQNVLSASASSFYFNFAKGGFGGDGGAAGSGPFAGLAGHGGTGGATAGAAIYNHLKSSTTISNSTFAFNTAASGESANAGSNIGRGKSGPAGPNSSGGALANLGTNWLINCTFFANGVVAGQGGNGADSSVQGGKGGSGGAAYGGNVFNGGKRALMLATNCTFSDGGAIPGTNGVAGSGPFAGKDGAKGASRGGNVANSNGVFHLKNNLITYPSKGTNGYGTFKDAGFNFSSDRSIKLNRKLGSITNADPKLDILRPNGGPVETMELLTGSRAIDAGDTNFVLSTDARGVSRPLNMRGDIGAYEVGAFLVPPRIVTQPVSQIAREDATIVFSVVAQGDPPLRYQWRKGTSDITGETTDTLTLFGLADDDAGDYLVVVSNNSGSTSSETATLVIVHPPIITEDLASFTNGTGEDFSLSITAEGDETLAYEWYRNGQRILGANFSTLFVADPQSTADYYVIVRNQYGFAASSIARVTIIQTPPSIITQPTNLVVAVSNEAKFIVEASGSRPQSYQWYFNTTNLLTGATNALLRIFPAYATNAGSYHVVVSNAVGTAASTNATLIVQTARPTITSQPANAGVLAGSTATFSVGVGGSAPFGYQWYFNTTTNFTATTPVSGGTNAALAVTNAQTANVGFYQVVVTNLLGSATSAPAALTIQSSAPLIQTNPVSATIFSGETNTFSVVAIGSAPLLYQWYFNSNVVLGATNSTFTINGAQPANSGTYRVTVTNGLGSVTSAPVVLTVSNSAPIITVQPVDVVALDIDIVTLSVTAIGSKPLTFQWYRTVIDSMGLPVGGYVAVTNGTSATLTLPVTVPGSETDREGLYQVIITNGFGSVSSAEVFVDISGYGFGN